MLSGMQKLVLNECKKRTRVDTKGSDVVVMCEKKVATGLELSDVSVC